MTYNNLSTKNHLFNKTYEKNSRDNIPEKKNTHHSSVYKTNAQNILKRYFVAPISSSPAEESFSQNIPLQQLRLKNALKFNSKIGKICFKIKSAILLARETGGLKAGMIAGLEQRQTAIEKFLQESSFLKNYKKNFNSAIVYSEKKLQESTFIQKTIQEDKTLQATLRNSSLLNATMTKLKERHPQFFNEDSQVELFRDQSHEDLEKEVEKRNLLLKSDEIQMQVFTSLQIAYTHGLTDSKQNSISPFRENFLKNHPYYQEMKKEFSKLADRKEEKVIFWQKLKNSFDNPQRTTSQQTETISGLDYLDTLNTDNLYKIYQDYIKIYRFETHLLEGILQSNLNDKIDSSYKNKKKFAQYFIDGLRKIENNAYQAKPVSHRHPEIIHIVAEGVRFEIEIHFDETPKKQLHSSYS